MTDMPMLSPCSGSMGIALAPADGSASEGKNLLIPPQFVLIPV